MTAAGAGDFARRVAHRRRELGLSVDDVARRAGMHADYVEYLERAPFVALGPGALRRLAAALETSLEGLRGGGIDRPPGPGRSGPRPHLDILSSQECQAHLAGGGVGRFVFVDHDRPVALPVNFRMLEGDVVFRTRATGVLAAAAGARVGFEVDRIDDAMSEGWSVFVGGRARLVDDPGELDQIAMLGIEPWPGGRREAVIRIESAELSGRRIRRASSTAASG